jgi:hypothetical protein
LAVLTRKLPLASETVSGVEKIKIFLGKHPQTPQVNEHFADEKTLTVSLPPLNSTIVAFAPPLTKILNETLVVTS